jgi:hypothetical protein
MRLYFILTCLALAAAALGSFFFQSAGFSGGRW